MEKVKEKSMRRRDYAKVEWTVVFSIIAVLLLVTIPLFKGIVTDFKKKTAISDAKSIEKAFEAEMLNADEENKLYDDTPNGKNSSNSWKYEQSTSEDTFKSAVTKRARVASVKYKEITVFYNAKGAVLDVQVKIDDTTTISTKKDGRTFANIP